MNCPAIRAVMVGAVLLIALLGCTGKTPSRGTTFSEARIALTGIT